VFRTDSWPFLSKLIQINTSAYRTALSSASNCILSAAGCAQRIQRRMRIVAAPDGAADTQESSPGTVNSGESYLIRIDNPLSPPQAGVGATR
jgi:hypothetical protein